MKAMQLLCLILLLALTLTACTGQTSPPTGTKITTVSTGTSTTVDSRVAEPPDITTQQPQESSTGGNTTASETQTSPTGSPKSTSIQNTTTTKQNQTTAVTTAVTTTKRVTSTTKTTTTTTTSTTTTKKTNTTAGSTITVAQYESEVLRLVNIERAAQGLSPLSAGSSAAMQAADVRADEIKTSFSHTRPNGNSCFTALTEAGVSYRAAGENIASGYHTPAAVVEGWMNSPGHRSNILNATFTHLAVGYDDYNWVQLFYA